jgi:hypothetical protein
MKYITLVLLVVLAPAILASQTNYSPVPKFDKVENIHKNYYYIYPTVTAPTCAPSLRLKMKDWYKEHEQKILIDEAQDNLFRNEFENIVKKEGAKVRESGLISAFMKKTYLNSRTALNLNLLADIFMDMQWRHKYGKEESRLVSGDFDMHDLRDLEVVKPDVIFINYSHASDYSLLGIPRSQLPERENAEKRWSDPNTRFVKTHMLWKYFPSVSESGRKNYTQVNQFGPIGTLKKERLYVLNLLEHLDIKIKIFNRFYDIPDYIREHNNVEIIRDKSDFENNYHEPHYYSWTNNQGKEIQAGFLGLPFYGSRSNLYRRGIMTLLINERPYQVNVKTLSKESRLLASSLMNKEQADNYYMGKPYDKTKQ